MTVLLLNTHWQKCNSQKLIIMIKLSAANSAFQQLTRNIWSFRALTLSVKCNCSSASSCQCCYTLENICWEATHQPFGCVLMNCLRRICGISLPNHVPNVDILNRCNTLSVKSQLQGKRSRWLGHFFRMPDGTLPEKLAFGEVKRLCPPGRPRSSFNDVALRDCQSCQMSIEMRKTDCLGKTRLVLHAPSSS